MYHGFHRGVDSPFANALGLHEPITSFEKICQYLSQQGLAMSLAEAVAIWSGSAAPRSGVVITMDDGYASNYHLAFPVLKQYQIPAIIFAATEFINEGITLWPDRVAAGIEARGGSLMQIPVLCEKLKKEPQTALFVEVAKQAPNTQNVTELPHQTFQPLTWAQALEMQQSGLVEFGGHTHTHRILGRCDRALAQEEIQRSTDILTERLGRRPRFFAYPNGQAEDFNITTQELLRAAGYQAAVTTIEDWNAAPVADFFALRRFGVPQHVPHLSGLAAGTAEILAKRRFAQRRAAIVPASPKATT
jgi:peptidoglycan/xylan/chitin deacetylase (PgdA/CDA1 family)